MREVVLSSGLCQAVGRVCQLCLVVLGTQHVQGHAFLGLPPLLLLFEGFEVAGGLAAKAGCRVVSLLGGTGGP